MSHVPLNQVSLIISQSKFILTSFLFYLIVLYCTICSGSLLTLQGPGAYDAAVYCASVSAARRQLNQSSSTQDTSSTSQNNPATVNSANNNLTTSPLSPDRIHHQRHTIAPSNMNTTSSRTNSVAMRHTSMIDRTTSIYEVERAREETGGQIRRSRTVMMNYDTVMGDNRNGNNRRIEHQNNNVVEMSSRKGWRKVVRKMKYLYNKLSRR